MTSDPDRKSPQATEFTKFDASDYLDSEVAIEEFLAVAKEDENPEVLAAALQDAAKARLRISKAEQ